MPRYYQDVALLPSYGMICVTIEYRKGLEAPQIKLMDESTKRRFDAIIELWNRPWQNITERRSYEWRVSFTLWTAFAALIALVLTNTLPGPAWAVSAAVGIIGLALCVLHGFYLSGVGWRHATDREIAIHYEKILQNLSNSSFDKEFAQRLAYMRDKQRTLFGDWSRRVQFMVTVVLLISAVLAVMGTSA